MKGTILGRAALPGDAGDQQAANAIDASKMKREVGWQITRRGARRAAIMIVSTK
jgi:hypothetical protein